MSLNRFRLPGIESRFTRIQGNKAYLVILRSRKSDPGFEESLQEMKELALAAGIRVVGETQANVNDPSPSHFLREGKLSEIRDAVKRSAANVLIINTDLSPTQGSNVQAFVQIPVMDRTGLILDIFGRRARSKEGKLQVELAQLNYALPRLGGLGGVMSRLGGGIGTRGPGEQELERDRRKVRRRIQQVKEDLEKVKKHRELLRQGRKRKKFISVALVGYTNAGKSTMLNALTGSNTYVEDKMFATLDPVTRVQNINGRYDILFIDTVGFLRNLPHSLVESFHATLEEVVEADILIHVLDVAHPKAVSFKESVESVLKEIKADHKPLILALNKADLLDAAQRKWAENQWPQGILISAKESLGVNGLVAKLSDLAGAESKDFEHSEKG